MPPTNDIAFWQIAAQLGVGAFMGCVMGVMLFLVVKMILHTFREDTKLLMIAFKEETKLERERNDRNLGRLFSRMDRLSEGFDLAKCRYFGPYAKPPEEGGNDRGK